MLLHDALARHKSVLCKIASRAEMPRFVHADMNALCTKRLDSGADQMLDESIRLVSTDKQRFIIFLDVIECRPL